MSRVLLVTPVFHGYWRSVAAALEHRGHEVATVRYDERRPLARVRHQLTQELPIRLGRTPPVDPAPTRAAVGALEQTRPDVVVALKGDVVGEDFWAEVERRRLPRVLWLYDEQRRTTWTTDRLRRVGPVATYSAEDAARLAATGVAASHLPLAFDPRVGSADSGVRREEVVLVGARYPRRTDVVTGLAAAGVPVRTYGRDWSRHPVDRLRTWGGRRPRLPAGRDLSRAEAGRVNAAAVAALNVHADQDGFTMRTFEVCGVGGLQLIDRADVGELYEPGRELLTFADVAEAVDLVGRARREPRWADGVRAAGRRRTLAEHAFDHRVARLEELWERC